MFVYRGKFKLILLKVIKGRVLVKESEFLFLNTVCI